MSDPDTIAAGGARTKSSVTDRSGPPGQVGVSSADRPFGSDIEREGDQGTDRDEIDETRIDPDEPFWSFEPFSSGQSDTSERIDAILYGEEQS